jgi:hypothetical protein
MEKEGLSSNIDLSDKIQKIDNMFRTMDITTQDITGSAKPKAAPTASNFNSRG